MRSDTRGVSLLRETDSQIKNPKMASRVQHLSAVDDEGMPGHERSFVGNKK
jgi:hypothetical protein